MAGGLPQTSLSYGNDAEHRLRDMTSSAADGTGVTATYTYSPASEVQSITSSLNDSTHPPDLVSKVQNGPDGPTSWQLGNGVDEGADYDLLGRPDGTWVCVESIQPDCTGSGSERYSSWGDRQGQQTLDSCSGPGPCILYGYGYDQFNRLTAMRVAVTGQQLYSYVYDRYGNRWQQNALQGGWSSNLSFNPATNQINSAGYVYDAAGNLINDGVHSYAYDAEGNLLQVDGGSTATYQYSALNQRVRIDEGGNAEGFIYNQSGQRASMWNINSGSQIRGDTYWGGLPVEFNSNGQANYVHADWRGTDQVYTSYNGTFEEGQFSGLPFGDGSGATGSGFEPWVSAQMDKDYYNSSDSGTDHAQFRQYDDGQGSWMSPDPYSGSYDFSNPQSLNRYSYVMNNPLTFADPSGLDGDNPITTGGGVGGCIGAAASEGASVPSDVGCGIVLIEKLASLFDSPSFHGSLKPRPSASDPAGFGENLGLPALIPEGNWGLGLALDLPQEGCEFGACGSAGDAFNDNGQPTVKHSFSLAYSGSLIIPVWFGLGPALSASYVPNLHLVCGGAGVGYSLGHSVSAGAVAVNANHAKDVLGSWSFAAGYNLGPLRGGQGSINSSGGTAGYSIGVPGASASVTYSWCHHF